MKQYFHITSIKLHIQKIYQHTNLKTFKTLKLLSITLKSFPLNEF